MCDTFVSYARENSELAKKLVMFLSDSGVDVWFDQLLSPGVRWRQEVARKLAVSKSVLVLWTPESIRSDEVYSEADYGYTNELLIPVATKNSLEIQFPFNQLHTIPWYGDDAGQDRLILDAVRRKINVQRDN